ncbi:hypothetical protein M758_3G237400 [Ceratodon purpureus]|nr:hypothetical protein M758_3G237400 [Ceratodon purpureus]
MKTCRSNNSAWNNILKAPPYNAPHMIVLTCHIKSSQSHSPTRPSTKPALTNEHYSTLAPLPGHFLHQSTVSTTPNIQDNTKTPVKSHNSFPSANQSANSLKPQQLRNHMPNARNHKELDPHINLPKQNTSSDAITPSSYPKPLP